MFVRAFRHRAVELQVPRTLVTPHLMGRTIGPVGDLDTQRRVVEASLTLLAEADRPTTIRDLSSSDLSRRDLTGRDLTA
ncbi:MAG: hypothetical protein ACLFRD_05645 [Nitriliruptoraceae bacterium]